MLLTITISLEFGCSFYLASILSTEVEKLVAFRLNLACTMSCLIGIELNVFNLVVVIYELENCI